MAPALSNRDRWLRRLKTGRKIRSFLEAHIGKLAKLDDRSRYPKIWHAVRLSSARSTVLPAHGTRGEQNEFLSVFERRNAISVILRRVARQGRTDRLLHCGMRDYIADFEEAATRPSRMRNSSSLMRTDITCDVPSSAELCLNMSAEVASD